MSDNKRGRKCKYETNVKPYLKNIKKWIEQGATEKQIAEQLGVAYSSFNEYKLKFSELSEVLKTKNMAVLVDELRSALVKKALGFEYKEKKEYIKEDPNTGDKTKYIEITTRQSLPDTTAIFGALNIYDETYVKDKASHELKKQELELRKELAKANSFDLDIE